MKTIQSIIATIIFLCTLNSANAQTLNWSSLSEQHRHIVNVNGGWSYGLTTGIGYGYKFNTKIRNYKIPIMLNTEFSAPIGDKVFDDFKTKLGGQVALVQLKGFTVTAKVYSLFWRYESDYTRLASFGSEFATVIGYYRPRWYVAGEFGFDKAVSTHIKNSDILKEYYPAIQDGWYVPTGGNFFYGFQAGTSFKNNDLYLRLGTGATQDLKSTALIPHYFQLGYNRKFLSK